MAPQINEGERQAPLLGRKMSQEAREFQKNMSSHKQRQTNSQNFTNWSTLSTHGKARCDPCVALCILEGSPAYLGVRQLRPALQRKAFEGQVLYDWSIFACIRPLLVVTSGLSEALLDSVRSQQGVDIHFVGGKENSSVLSLLDFLCSKHILSKGHRY